jgi:hypothetical protein
MKLLDKTGRRRRLSPILSLSVNPLQAAIHNNKL